MITREPEYWPPTTNVLETIGRQVVLSSREAGRVATLLAQAIMSTRYAFQGRARKAIVAQMFEAGIKSLGVITVVAVFTGMILALQTGLEMRRFNQEVFIGTAVMVSMLREMGPFMTGLILAACVGSAMAAQIGTMVVSEEVAALEVMSIDPVRFLVMPRLVAMCIMTPLLSFYSCIMGVLGGGVVGMTQLGVAWTAYMQNATDYAETRDLYVGMFKAFLYGMIITSVACNEGFATVGGGLGVGMATRRAVIVSFLIMLIVGYYVTRLFCVS